MIKTRTRRIGALWVRKTKEGKTYLSGILETLAGDVGIVAFQNDKKTKDNQPDYNLCISGDREEEGGGKANTVGEVPIVVLDDGQALPSEKIGEDKAGESEVNVKDIPF